MTFTKEELAGCAAALRIVFDDYQIDIPDSLCERGRAVYEQYKEKTTDVSQLALLEKLITELEKL